MQYIRPDYYKEFQCIGKDCPDTCCAGWNIEIDDSSYQRYQTMKGPFANRLRNSVDWKKGTFLQYNHQCMLLNEDKLCDLYTEAGKNYLCKTCSQYPRHMEEFETAREISLSLSCPEVARILMTKEDQIGFIKHTKESKKTDVWYELLSAVRNSLIEIMQNQEMDVRYRMALCLCLAHDLQGRYKSKDAAGIKQKTARYLEPVNTRRLVKKIAKFEERDNDKFYLMNKMSKVLMKLKPVYISASENMKNKLTTLYQQTEINYHRLYANINEIMSSQWMEQLMIYFIFTYVCGAVYDGELYSKVKLSVMSVLWIFELEVASYLISNQINMGDIIENAYQYAREVEHLDQNLILIEKTCQENSIFSLYNLLTCLVN